MNFINNCFVKTPVIIFTLSLIYFCLICPIQNTSERSYLIKENYLKECRVALLEFLLKNLAESAPAAFVDKHSDLPHVDSQFLVSKNKSYKKINKINGMSIS